MRSAFGLVVVVAACTGAHGRPDAHVVDCAVECADPACREEPACVRCGDGIAAGAEDCDGADLRGKSCGDFGFNSGHLACHPACVYDLRPCATVELCMNGIDDDGNGAKDCDDPACADSPACSTCGDGVVTGPEECDDGNHGAGDCCDECRAEPGCEREPNGTRATALAIVPDGSGRFVMRGWISPAGDVDVYALTVPAAHTAIVTAETHAFASGDTCTRGVDSQLELRAADGSVVGADDDGGAGACSFLRFAGLAAGPATLAVRASPFAPGDVFGYRLDVSVELAACGDGVVQEGQECDDGNARDGDGCSGRCRLEPALEREPDDDAGSADGPFAPPFAMLGVIDPPQADNLDSDWVALDLPAPANLRIETFDENAARCDHIIAVPSLHAADGSRIAVPAGAPGPARCGLLSTADGLPGALGAPFPQLPAGRYFVKVASRPSPGRYRLKVTQVSVCGNSIVEPPEQCDGGPGCSACRLE